MVVAHSGRRLGLGLLAKALETCLDAVEIVDVTGELVYVNEAWCRLFGQGREGVIGRWAVDIYASLNRGEGLRRSLLECLDAGDARGLLVTTGPGGQEVIAPYTRVLYRNVDGLPTAIVTVYRELLSGASPHESALMRALAEGTGNGIALFDARGEVLYVNKAFADTAGYDVRELAGMRMEYILLGSGAAVSDINRGRRVWRGHVQIARRSGPRTTVSAAVSSVRSSEGAILGYVVTTTPTAPPPTTRSPERSEQEHRLRNAAASIMAAAELLRREIQDPLVRRRVDVILDAVNESMAALERLRNL